MKKQYLILPLSTMSEKMIFKIFVLTFFGIVLVGLVHPIIISEIMYNPEGSDLGKEWIELYNDKSENINLSELKLFENNVKHKIKAVSKEILRPGEFAVIVEDIENFTAFYNPSSEIIIADSTFSLRNSGEYIAILNKENEVLFETEYSDIAKEGNSICYSEKVYKECTPTPGKKNLLDSQNKKEMQNQTKPLECDLSVQLFLYNSTYNFLIENKKCANKEKYDLIIDEFSGEKKHRKVLSGYLECKEILSSEINPQAEIIKVQLMALSCQETYTKDNYDELNLRPLPNSSENQGDKGKIFLEYQILEPLLMFNINLSTKERTDIEVKVVNEKGEQLTNSLNFNIEKGFEGEIRGTLEITKCENNAFLKLKNQIKEIDMPLKLKCEEKEELEQKVLDKILAILSMALKIVTSL